MARMTDEQIETVVEKAMSYKEGSKNHQAVLPLLLVIAELSQRIDELSSPPAQPARPAYGFDKGGRLPLGYWHDGRGFRIDDGEGKMVKRMLDLRDQGVSLREIARIMSTDERAISHSTVQYVVNNRAVYEGKQQWKGCTLPPIIE